MDKVEINKTIKLSEHLALPSEAALSHLSEPNGVHLTPHFSLAELTATSVRTADGNIPSHVAIENLKRVCKWLEELRYSYNTLYCLKPGEDYETSENVEGIIINSGYRSPAVNKLAGGVATSNHLTGCAVDIRVAGKEQLIRYACILIDIADDTDQDFDELLLEHGSNGVIWLHFAVRPPGQHNRRKINFLQG